jgi:hypothetical protein
MKFLREISNSVAAAMAADTRARGMARSGPGNFSVVRTFPCVGGASAGGDHHVHHDRHPATSTMTIN